MKLLSKSQIAKQKADERQRDIAEGLKLAKRTDELRRITAEEEVALERFRTESITEIMREISDSTEARDKLRIEVADLENRRIAALRPIEHLRQEAEREREANKEVASQIDKRLENLAQKELLLESREKEITLVEERLEWEHSEVKRHHARAEKLTNERHALLEETTLLANERIKELDARENTIALREEALHKREVAVEKFALKQDEIRVALDQKQRWLADREATINQNEQRKIRSK